jgi:hypothetical protein
MDRISLDPQLHGDVAMDSARNPADFEAVFAVSGLAIKYRINICTDL